MGLTHTSTQYTLPCVTCQFILVQPLHSPNLSTTADNFLLSHLSSFLPSKHSQAFIIHPQNGIKYVLYVLLYQVHPFKNKNNMVQTLSQRLIQHKDIFSVSLFYVSLPKDWFELTLDRCNARDKNTLCPKHYLRPIWGSGLKFPSVVSAMFLTAVNTDSIASDKSPIPISRV